MRKIEIDYMKHICLADWTLPTEDGRWLIDTGWPRAARLKWRRQIKGSLKISREHLHFHRVAALSKTSETRVLPRWVGYRSTHCLYLDLTSTFGWIGWLKGDAIMADPIAIRFFIYHSNLPPNYAQLLKEQNKRWWVSRVQTSVQTVETKLKSHWINLWVPSNVKIKLQL